ncbi:MAG: response regulator [Deltaproteobacteria bacterium]|jgi:CheY-like chemotaxis protein|nr:response regulator [Deltaproteobacteria bacterium]
MEVADSGVGIKEGDLSELFTSFARFDREINQDVEGSGLGLSITKGLIDAMGGQIAVSSIYGVGSVFTVTIPQTVVSKAPVGDGLIQDFAADQSDLSVHFVAPEAKILIVDDIRTNLKVSRGLLAAYEAQIDLCDQAREAAGLVEKGGYDLVFLDHMMPFMTGVEVAAKIRAMDGPAGKTPLIALTGDAAPEMAKMFLEKGFNDVLAKPVDLARLGEVMDRWIPKSLRHDPASRGKSKESGLAGPVPEGLNVREGLTRSGSKPGFYLEALACFRSDALERLETLSQKPDAENLPTIAGQLHALKAAAGGVGANLLAAKASALDAAAKKGDLPLVQKALPSFTEGLSKLLGELSSFISVNASKLADPDATMDPQTLKRLIEALDNEDIKKIDELLDAMPRAGADTPMGALLSDVSEAVLRLELPKAADLVKAYLAIHFPEAQAAGQAEASADPLAAR